jgi:lactoylglutathione lyase
MAAEDASTGLFNPPFPIMYVTDVERSLRFYCEGFDFVLSYRWPTQGPPEYVYLRLGEGGIGLADATAAERLEGRTLAHAPPRFELCFYAEDLDAACERLRALGASELVEPEDKPWGERMAYFEDPDGNPIHVTAPIRDAEQ